MKLSNVLSFVNVGNHYPAIIPSTPDGIPLTSAEWKEYVDRVALGYSAFSDEAILEYIKENWPEDDDSDQRRIKQEQEYIPLTPEQRAERKKRSTNMAIAKKMNNGICHYCQENPATCADHVIPERRGGSNELENLVPCCRSCNSSKGSRTPEEWLGAR